MFIHSLRRLLFHLRRARFAVPLLKSVEKPQKLTGETEAMVGHESEPEAEAEAKAEPEAEAEAEAEPGKIHGHGSVDALWILYK